MNKKASAFDPIPDQLQGTDIIPVIRPGSNLKTTLSAVATFIMAAVTAITNNKVDKVSGKGLSTEDFTTVDKAKLDALTGVTLTPDELTFLQQLKANYE